MEKIKPPKYSKDLKTFLKMLAKTNILKYTKETTLPIANNKGYTEVRVKHSKSDIVFTFNELGQFTWVSPQPKSNLI